MSHPTALSCIRSADHAVHIWAVHKFLQDAKLLFGAGRHQILPLLRQNGQICDTPLDVFGIVDVGRCQFHQVPHAPAYQIAVALKVAVLTVGGTEDFSVSHGNGRLFRYDQFCDKYPSILFRIAICRRQTAAIKSDRFGIFLLAGFFRLVLHRDCKVALVPGITRIGVKGFFFGLFLLFLLHKGVDSAASSQSDQSQYA